MLSAVAGSGAGGMFALVAYLLTWTSDPPLERIPATASGSVFEPWRMDAFSTFDDQRDLVEPECTFWNTTVRYESDLCSHFSLSRNVSTSAVQAHDRALRCAALHEVDCLLSPEIGLSIPAVFVYDEAEGMRLLVAPRMLPHTNETRSIQWQNPDARGATFRFNLSVRVEYLNEKSRAPQVEVLEGVSAYCVQALRAAFVPECWNNLD